MERLEDEYEAPKLRDTADAFTDPAIGPSEVEAETLDLSVVMPCLNERLTLGTCIEKSLATIERLGLRGEVIVADNGSTDGSQQIASALGARVISIEARGYGSALGGGIAASRGKFVVMGDSDDSYDFTQIGDFVSKLDEGYDLVMGNRFKGGIRPMRCRFCTITWAIPG